MKLSIFKDIKSLPPASYMSIDLETGKSDIQSYWELDLPLDKDCEIGTLEGWKTVVREQLDEAVKHRLRADVPVGVYLS